MEEVKETNPQLIVNEIQEEIKPVEQQSDKQQKADNQLQEQQQQKQELQEQQQEQQEKKIETPGEKEPQNQPKQEIHAIAYEEDDEEDDDDDEEKETSQKLVIDIPDEEEEGEEKDEDDENEVIILDEIPQAVSEQKDIETISHKPEDVEAIITLSDGEEDIAANEAALKPGKVQKRRSVGAATSANDEEHYRLKRRKINVAGAPKMPLTGYVRYMNDRRESLRKEHPTKTSIEHTRMIGEEWHALPADVKSSYLKAADVDKQRYVKELHSFLKSRPDILASELAKNKIRKTAENNSPNPSAASFSSSTATKSVLKDKLQPNECAKSSKDSLKDKLTKEMVPTPSTSHQATEKSNNEKNKRKRTPTPTTFTTTNTTNASSSAAAAAASSTTSSSIVTPTPGEIPIFTNEFLEHNKIYDMELRSLRKSKTDLEQQNSVLEKHVENMKFGVEKMMTENNELEEKNRLLEIYLDKLKRKLALALNSLPLPSAPNGATVDNIDKYMQDLYKMSTSNSTGPATLNKAKDIIRKLDLQIQL